MVGRTRGTTTAVRSAVSIWKQGDATTEIVHSAGSTYEHCAFGVPGDLKRWWACLTRTNERTHARTHTATGVVVNKLNQEAGRARSVLYWTAWVFAAETNRGDLGVLFGLPGFDGLDYTRT